MINFLENISSGEAPETAEWWIIGAFKNPPRIAVFCGPLMGLINDPSTEEYEWAVNRQEGELMRWHEVNRIQVLEGTYGPAKDYSDE
jgi:hypothetical protein